MSRDLFIEKYLQGKRNARSKIYVGQDIFLPPALKKTPYLAILADVTSKSQIKGYEKFNLFYPPKII